MQFGTYNNDKEALRSRELFDDSQYVIHCRTDRMFAILMLLQWVAGIIVATFISPKSWTGTDDELLVHIWTAVLLGGAIASMPVILAFKRPGQSLTRYVIAVAQMMTSALLIHITGGRIETHFHVFGSLAFLSFYRDWKILATATTVIICDYFFRGIFWTESLFGSSLISQWRWLEYVGWIVFEDVFLFMSIHYGRADLNKISDRQTKFELLNSEIEEKIVERTGELNQEVMVRKKTEEALRNRELLLHSTLESTADGILVVAGNGKVTHTNKKFQEMWQIPDDVMQCNDAYKLREFVSNQLEDSNGYLKSIDEMLTSTGETTELIKFKDGRVFQRFSRPLIHSEIQGGRLWSYRDITKELNAERAQKELEGQLERAEKLESLGQLAGGVAHDLNNMLGPVVGYSEMLVNELPENSKSSKRAAKIKISAERAAVVIQDLLTLARRGKYEMRPVNLNDVIQEFIESPSNESLQKKFPKIRVKLDLSKELGIILGSVPHLSKVVMNLVTNAFEAIGDGGNVTIATENLLTEKGKYCVLKVHDTGHGIAEDDMSKIFEPFFSKKQMGSSGSGLGLSVVYGIVKDHKGLTDVQSELNKGTDFILYFPATNSAKVPKRGVQYSVVGGSESILVVDDSAEQRELIHEIIDNLGYFVVTAPDGHYAVDFIKANPVDLVILDMIMEPDFDGLDTYREMLKINPEQKAIVVSGFSESERVEEVMNLGAETFVKKPYNIDTLAGAIRRALDKTPSLVPETID